MSTNTIPMQVPRADGAFTWPRRSCLDQLGPAELKLYEAIQTIDQLPGDTTDIVLRLQECRERLADFVERAGLIKPQ